VKTAIARNWGDRDVKVEKGRLLAKLRENRAQHRQEYKEACEGYATLARENLLRKFEKAKKELERAHSELLARFDDFDPKTDMLDTFILHQGVSFKLQVPVDHTKDYDIAIQMAEWSVSDEIEITQSQLQCFIMDYWGWKNDFENVSNFYKSAKRPSR